MNARRFCIQVFSVSALVALVLVAINYYTDAYGLFRPVKGRALSIYADERTAKYLLAHHYVPENFEAYIIGPSLSANLDPKKIAEYKIYNLSMMGANITEEKAVVEQALAKAKPKFVIVCLHPYLTHDHGMKTGMINPREYFGALGSISLYKSYALRFVRDHHLLKSKFPPDQFNDYGANHYNTLLQKMPVADKIAEQLTLSDAINTTIDPVAWEEFNALMNEFTASNIQIIAYFHPLPFPIYDKFRRPLEAYRMKLDSTLQDRATIINFNDPDHEFFTKDLSNYIDHGHLSDKGEAYILREILRRCGRVK